MSTLKELKQICQRAGINCPGNREQILRRIREAKKDLTILPSIRRSICPTIRNDMKKADLLRIQETNNKNKAAEHIHKLDALIADAQKQRNAWYAEYVRAERAYNAAVQQMNSLRKTCQETCESASEPCLFT